MRNTQYKPIFIVLIIALIFSGSVRSQEITNLSDIYFYKKKELNRGFRFYSNKNREELRTISSRTFEEINSSSATFQFENNYWNYLDYKQEQYNITLKAGPLFGWGNYVDSSYVENIEAEKSFAGLTAEVCGNYLQRYYWDRKNYTIVDISAWGKYSLYKQNSDGTRIDSNLVSTPYEVSENTKKFRYGFQAKAGWGIGRLNPVNNFMIADYLLEKYFPGRNFSKLEVVKAADEIGKIKSERSIQSKRNIENEAETLNQFVSKEFLLSKLENLENEYQFGEFLPRFDGSRIEAGPFFNYFNREPDFVYGGYLKYENSKYRNFKISRNFSTVINYNRYKRQDWMLAEICIGWSYFSGLKSQWDFGIKYIPGMVVNRFEDLEPVVHNFVPYFRFYTQVNTSLRLQADASYRINNNEQFMTAGPEFSLKVYWSRY